MCRCAESDQIRQGINRRFFEVAARVQEFADQTRADVAARVVQGDPLLAAFKTFREFDDLETYIVAHSEGTVVAFNSLVQAAMVREGIQYHAGEDEFTRASWACQDVAKIHPSDWLPKVAGLVTLGSPLDKHHVLWKARFRKHWLKTSPPRIRWFNFYDWSDPVAYAIEELLRRVARRVRQSRSSGDGAVRVAAR